MKEKIAFICIGQAAGNIGELFAEQGYNVFAINTSKEDLSTLKSIPHVWHIPGGLGYAKDRKKAREVISDNFDRMVEQINNYVPEPIIYFIFSAGGGTGSGISPWTIDILINDVFVIEDDDGEYVPTKSVGAITILAADSESPKARENTYTCLADLQKIEGLKNLFILDNSSMPDYASINKRFVELFTSVLAIPEKCKDKNGNVDQAEIIKVFTTPGVSYIAKLSNKKASTRDLVDRLKNGIFSKMNDSPDGRTIRYILSSTYEALDYKMLVGEFGQYVDEFHTFNDYQSIIMLAGMPFPFDRLAEIKQGLDEDSRRMRSVKSKVNESELDSNVDLFSDDSDSKIRKRRSSLEMSETGNGTVKEKRRSRRDELLAKIAK